MKKQFTIRMSPDTVTAEELDKAKSIGERLALMFRPKIETSEGLNDRLKADIYMALSHLVGEPMDNIGADKGKEMLKPVFESRGWTVEGIDHKWFYDERSVEFTITAEKDM